MKKKILYLLSVVGFFAILVVCYIAFNVLSGGRVSFGFQNHADTVIKEVNSWSSCEGESVKLTQSQGLKPNVELVVFVCDKIKNGSQIRVSVFQSSELIEQQTIDVIHIKEMSQGKAFTPIVAIENNFDIMINQQAGYFVPALDSEYYALKQIPN